MADERRGSRILQSWFDRSSLLRFRLFGMRFPNDFFVERVASVPRRLFLRFSSPPFFPYVLPRLLFVFLIERRWRRVRWRGAVASRKTWRPSWRRTVGRASTVRKQAPKQHAYAHGGAGSPFAFLREQTPSPFECSSVATFSGRPSCVFLVFFFFAVFERDGCRDETMRARHGRDGLPGLG